MHPFLWSDDSFLNKRFIFPCCIFTEKLWKQVNSCVRLSIFPCFLIHSFAVDRVFSSGLEVMNEFLLHHWQLKKKKKLFKWIKSSRWNLVSPSQSLHAQRLHTGLQEWGSSALGCEEQWSQISSVWLIYFPGSRNKYILSSSGICYPRIRIQKRETRERNPSGNIFTPPRSSAKPSPSRVKTVVYFSVFFFFLFPLLECGSVVSKPLQESILMMMMWKVCDVVDNNHNIFLHRKLDFEQWFYWNINDSWLQPGWGSVLE